VPIRLGVARDRIGLSRYHLKQLSANLLILGWIFGVALVVAAILFLVRFMKRKGERRHRCWLARASDICDRATVLSTALRRLMQRVPDEAHWSDDRWSEGERNAVDLSKAIEQIDAAVPKAHRETVWNLVASLRALSITIGGDEKARRHPARPDVIRTRLADLEGAIGSLRAAGAHSPANRRSVDG